MKTLHSIPGKWVIISMAVALAVCCVGLVVWSRLTPLVSPERARALGKPLHGVIN